MQSQPALANYEQALASGAIKPDPAQRRAAQMLQQLLTQEPDTTKSWFWQKKAPTKSGLYMYGDVGRGKSMVMDLFFEMAKQHAKARRIHFHAFMLDVHKRMFAFRQVHQGEVIEHVIKEIAEETQILCLDELQVTDVADAMILARLFAGLMDAGVVVVFTSNRKPRDLYQGGLQRDQFLKFVDILEARMPLVEINGQNDYRLAKLKSLSKTFVYPCDADGDDFLMNSWSTLTEGAANEPLRIEVDGRVLRVDKQTHGVAWLTFHELCSRALGASDYLALAKQCHTILLQGIPKMTQTERNEAKRFVTLIDTLYDTRTKLIATAATSPEDLYPAGDGAFEFHRTVSRLHEMQSEPYWALPHIA